MLINTLTQLYERDLALLRGEIEKYANEADLWRVSGEIVNPAGSLCLHIAGNLQHFIGAVLGGTEYVRDRDAEFARRDVPQSEMLAEIDSASAAVKETLAKLNKDDLAKTYPIEVFGHPMTTEYFLVHLATHLNYHLGQINYHRRVLAGN